MQILNDPRADGEERLAALAEYIAVHPELTTAITGSGEINNHIHTIYSFSPYTPVMAALKARQAGLEAAGSVDHDSLAAAGELTAACARLGMGGCCGFEIRASFKKDADGNEGPFASRKINNPDSTGLLYMTVQGVPSTAYQKTADFLRPIQKARLQRTQRMTNNANILLRDEGLRAINFDPDIKDQSQAEKGGEITERHLMAAVAKILVEKFGKGSGLCRGLAKHFDIHAAPKTEALLGDASNPHYLYDLLGVLKTGFLSRIFIQPDENECIRARDAVDFALSIGAIPAYAYLGDVGESPTGDKKAEKFEDDYLGELMEEIKRTGFKAVTYMPPRNTPEQLQNIQRYCADFGFMEISGVDINSSRQGFNCPEVLSASCRHLVDTTWALIAHEQLAAIDKRWGLFDTDNTTMPLSKRLAKYAELGKALDLRHPGASAFDLVRKILEFKS
ncbi:MAG: PHP domain-containing protein [Treponema sp.]|jgi:hypothetical protein|nr:PHP domain-containing protein [Treponema sp.]